MSERKNHTISIKVTNKPGVLLRITTVFSRRAFNIDSLVVSPALDGHYSRLTLTVSGPQETLEQIIKQLNKLIDVIHASEHETSNTIVAELALIKLHISKEKRNEVLQVAEHFKGQTVDFNDESLVLQLTGNTQKLDAAIALLNDYNVVEIVRSGKLSMVRGKQET
ncbi:MAG: acetolactate synthase small subunit [bacterium]